MTANIVNMGLVRGFAPPENPKELAEEKLASSGLTLEDAEELGITWHSAEETTKLHTSFWSLPCLRLPYYAPDGETPLRSGTARPNFYRVRALRTPPMIGKKKFPKYLQPPNTGVCAYFPRNMDWSSVINDPQERIFITEGELKAAKGCREGFPVIGLGGVYNYRSAQQGISFLPELEAVNWLDRSVIICYDSDVSTNQMVCKAVMDIAETLVERGANPQFIQLPSNGDQKVGLDDFLVENSANVFDSLVEDSGFFITTARDLQKLNESYVFFCGKGLIIDRRTGEASVPEVFKLRTGMTPERVMKAGKLSMKLVPKSDAWIKWSLRADVENLTYAPDQPPLSVVDGDNGLAFNTWKGWRVKPISGDVSPFLTLVDHLFTGQDEAKEWFLRWCAYPLQHPGTKLFTTVVLHGNEQGTGKSALGMTLGKIYGKNYTEIRQADLTAGFNEWAVGKQFVLGDDVTGSDKRETLDLLKKLITQEEVRVNIKHLPSYTIPDVINYMWTSNRAAAFLLDEQDRRFFVHKVEVGPLPLQFYKNYHKWRDEENGASHLFDYLLHLDLGDFSPHAPALVTQAKRDMTRAARGELSTWAHDLRDHADDMLSMGGVRVSGDLFTNTELRAIFAAREGLDARDVKPGAMNLALLEAGFGKVYNDVAIRADGRDPGRYYAVRNADRWLKASLRELKDHLAATNGNGGNRGTKF